MANNVNSAFSIFLRDTVNIPNDTSDNAKNSRSFLNSQIQAIANNGSFLTLAPEYNINFGSFARKTKIKPLDDIDLIIGLNGANLQIEGYQWDNIKLTVGPNCNDMLLFGVSDKYSQLWAPPIYQLNSNKVKNKLVSALQNVPQYEKAEIHARGEAVTLKLKSYDWNFDIVPAFYCPGDSFSKPFYLIPNGYGNWKKTNPKIEQDRVTQLNVDFNKVVLPTIRLVKYWNRRGQMPNITSYVLETIVLDYFSQAQHSNIKNNVSYDFPDLHFKNVLSYISSHIMCTVKDSKGFQGNINNLLYDQQNKIKTRAWSDYQKACNAVNAELSEKNMGKSISIWRDIFGDDFPKYDE